MEYVYVNQDIEVNIAMKDMSYMENYKMKMHFVIMDGQEIVVKKNVYFNYLYFQFVQVHVMIEEFVEMENVIVITDILEKHVK